jgi:hemin uptake protein HemP
MHDASSAHAIRSPRVPPPEEAPTAPPRRIGSHELLDGRTTVVIDHGGQEYRLRLTRNDKLILTK